MFNINYNNNSYYIEINFGSSNISPDNININIYRNGIDYISADQVIYITVFGINDIRWNLIYYKLYNKPLPDEVKDFVQKCFIKYIKLITFT